MVFLAIAGMKSMEKACRPRVFFVVFCVIFLMSQLCWAETAYVKDTLLITFRTGPSTKHTVISRLLSGQPVEILGVEGDWSHVQLIKEGELAEDGWVLSQYLITRQPWKMQAQTALEESAELREKVADLEKELSEAIRHGQELTVSLKDTTATLAELRQEHESLKKGSAGYLELKARHTENLSKLEAIQLELEELSKKYEKLKGSERWKWFGIGAGVFFLALITGIVLGRKQKKRRSSYY